MQSQHQGQLWQGDQQRFLQAQLCNALYAREIFALASADNTQRLQRRLASLPYYIERAANTIVSGNCPLELDAHHGGWVAKQTQSPPQHCPLETQRFYQKNAKLGVIVPVLVVELHSVTVKIDSIDEVKDNQVHLNQFGWFTFRGMPAFNNTQSQLRLLKPLKRHFTPAVCGHSWHGKTIAAKRVLSLREMLLASRINWQNFRKPL